MASGLIKKNKDHKSDDERVAFRPVLVSLAIHVLLAGWILGKLILAGASGGGEDRQLQIENEIIQATSDQPIEEDMPPEEEPSAESEPEAPSPRIDDDRILPAPWRRPVDLREQEVREDLKQASVVMKRARPLSSPKSAPTEVNEVESAAEPIEPGETAVGQPTSQRSGATKVTGACPSPEYPERARRRRLEGRVILLVDVAADGAVLDVRVQTESGYDILDRAAIAAVRRWRFTPALEGGKPVRDRLQIPITFRLR